MWSVHCKLGTVSLSFRNLLILQEVQGIQSAIVRMGAETQGRELCNENNLR